MPTIGNFLYYRLCLEHIGGLVQFVPVQILLDPHARKAVRSYATLFERIRNETSKNEMADGKPNEVNKYGPFYYHELRAGTLIFNLQLGNI